MQRPEPVETGEFARSDSYVATEGDPAGGFLILVDHASNHIPPEYSDLGLPTSELERHIGYDIGVAPLAQILAERFRAPALCTSFSRLLIDANRGEDDPTLIMRLSDGAVVPGNKDVDAAERARRLARFHRPYHAAIEATLNKMLATGRPPAILAIHSYTAVWKGARRPWHAGVLWDRDPRFALPLLNGLAAEAGCGWATTNPIPAR